MLTYSDPLPAYAPDHEFKNVNEYIESEVDGRRDETYLNLTLSILWRNGFTPEMYQGLARGYYKYLWDETVGYFIWDGMFSPIIQYF